MAISGQLDEDAVPRAPEDFARAQFQSPDALLNIDGTAAAYAALFRVFRILFGFDGALILQDDEAR
jgi:hypothetical protein